MSFHIGGGAGQGSGAPPPGPPGGPGSGGRRRRMLSARDGEMTESGLGIPQAGEDFGLDIKYVKKKPENIEWLIEYFEYLLYGGFPPGIEDDGLINRDLLIRPPNNQSPFLIPQ